MEDLPGSRECGAGQEGVACSLGLGSPKTPGCSSSCPFLLSSTLELDRVGVDSTEGRFLKKPCACLHHDPGRCGSVPFSE